MKVILVVPTHHYSTGYPVFLSFSDFPTGFGYLASSLKQAGHKVVGCNPNNVTGYVNARTMLTDILTKCLKENKDAGLIGLGGLATDYAFLKDAISIIRANSKIPIVLGGQIVTNDAEWIYSNLKPDYAVCNEGESAIVDIADNKVDAIVVRGIYYGQQPQNIEKLPFPDYTPFGIESMMDNYSDATRVLYRYSRPYPRVWGLVTARSCPFSCTFCIHGRRPIPYRARSIPNIMAEIKETYEKYHYNVLLILDELFAVNKERMNEFSLAVIEGKEKYGWDFDWTFQTHASAKLDLESLKPAKKAGCYMFSYGLESASKTVLESMNKKMKIEQVVEGIELAKQAKIAYSANLIFGDPAETDETFRESLAFWVKYGKDSQIFLSTIQPYPGSKIFDDCMERGLIKDKAEYYANIDRVQVNMTKMTDRDFSYRKQFIANAEVSWQMTNSTVTNRWEEDVEGVDSPVTPFMGKPYKIWCTCPQCKEDVMFRQRLLNPNHSYFLGLGCPKCGQKFRLDVMV
jgi:radical SAM superfamily enzyme YgiQ (UPF0313 family)